MRYSPGASILQNPPSIEYEGKEDGDLVAEIEGEGLLTSTPRALRPKVSSLPYAIQEEEEEDITTEAYEKETTTERHEASPEAYEESTVSMTTAAYESPTPESYSHSIAPEPPVAPPSYKIGKSNAFPGHPASGYDDSIASVRPGATNIKGKTFMKCCKSSMAPPATPDDLQWHKATIRFASHLTEYSL